MSFGLPPYFRTKIRQKRRWRVRANNVAHCISLSVYERIVLPYVVQVTMLAKKKYSVTAYRKKKRRITSLYRKRSVGPQSHCSYVLQKGRKKERKKERKGCFRQTRWRLGYIQKASMLRIFVCLEHVSRLHLYGQCDRTTIQGVPKTASPYCGMYDLLEIVSRIYCFRSAKSRIFTLYRWSLAPWNFLGVTLFTPDFFRA